MGNYNFYRNVIKIYFLSLLTAVIFSPLFGKIYIWAFKPLMTGGLEGLGDSMVLFYIQSAIFSLAFFIPLYTVFLINKKLLLVWLIGIIVPFAMAFVGGNKHLLWFVIFTVAGGIIGWLIKFSIKKFKKT